MRIGLVLPAPPGYSETFFHSKILGLVAAGHDLTLFVGKARPRFTLCKIVVNPGVSGKTGLQLIRMFLSLLVLIIRAPRQARAFYRLERRSGRTFREAIENLYLNSHILSHKLDWLHFGFATMALRRENVASAMGAKMGVSLRGYDISLYAIKHPGCYLLLWNKADKVHTISDALAQKAYALGLPNEKTVVKVTPALDKDVFRRTSAAGELSDPPRLLTVARLKWVKGLEYTLEALGGLNKIGLDFQYTIIGEGEEYERLCFAAHQLGIRDKVTFAGKLPHSEVKTAMEHSDLYLQYSIQEGFCNAVLEAQAMGLLCIVSNAEGLPENVLHGKTGWVVPRRQPGLLAKQIVDVLNMSEPQQREVRENAMERVRKEFNLEKQQKEFNAFYTQ